MLRKYLCFRIVGNDDHLTIHEDSRALSSVTTCRKAAHCDAFAV